MAKLFVSYKRGGEPDERLAEYFVSLFGGLGHEVFLDKQIMIGQEWPRTIREKLSQSDFLLVLISEAAGASEMIIEEVRIAKEYNQQTGKPIILPVRVKFTSTLPYDLGAKINRIQHASWSRDGDEEAIGVELKRAIEGNNSNLKIASSVPQKVSGLAADGNELAFQQALGCPLPSFDPRWLDDLDPPGGSVRLDSPFYIERVVDAQAKVRILRPGVTIRIKGRRQMGKSSLLARLAQHLRDKQLRVIYIDFQRLDDSHFQNLSSLLHYIASLVERKFRTKGSPDEYWQSRFGPKDKLTEFLQEELLNREQQPVIFLLDEVDRVFNRDYRADFFSLIRFWHNNRNIDPIWNRLNLVLAYSSEASKFIPDDNQSPFNVGLDYELQDFDRPKVAELNHLHGSPLPDTCMDDFVKIFGGHPYLVRKALYALVIHKTSVAQLIKEACNDDGLFADHLHHYLWRLHDQPELSVAMKTILTQGKCPNDELFQTLLSIGLVRGPDPRKAEARCGLYEKYFGSHL